MRISGKLLNVIAFSVLRLKLAEHMKLDDVLFLFGNGASIYAGSQDTRKFKLEDYKAKYADLSSIIDEVGKLLGIEDQLNALIIVRSYYNLVKDSFICTVYRHYGRGDDFRYCPQKFFYSPTSPPLTLPSIHDTMLSKPHRKG